MYTADASTEFDVKHFSAFEKAVEETDVEAYVYEEHGIKGQVIVLHGAELHQVTERNLVSFRKLNRGERRMLDKKYNANLARGTGHNEKIYSHINPT
jgi:hypothetical protein